MKTVSEAGLVGGLLWPVVIAVDEKMPREKTVEARYCCGDGGWLGCECWLERPFSESDLNQRIMQMGMPWRSLPSDIWHQFCVATWNFTESGAVTAV